MLIFVIFVVDLAVMKFCPPTKINAYGDMESMMIGVATKIVASRPKLPSVSKQQ